MFGCWIGCKGSKTGFFSGASTDGFTAEIRRAGDGGCVASLFLNILKPAD